MCSALCIFGKVAFFSVSVSSSLEWSENSYPLQGCREGQTINYKVPWRWTGLLLSDFSATVSHFELRKIQVFRPSEMILLSYSLDRGVASWDLGWWDPHKCLIRCTLFFLYKIHIICGLSWGSWPCLPVSQFEILGEKIWLAQLVSDVHPWSHHASRRGVVMGTECCFMSVLIPIL